MWAVEAVEWPWSLPSLELCSPVSTGLHLHPPHLFPPPQEIPLTLSAHLLASIATKERGAGGWAELGDHVGWSGKKRRGGNSIWLMCRGG